MSLKDVKVAVVLLRYDYGKKSRGESGEKSVMVPALEKVIGPVDRFWLEDNGYPDDPNGLQLRIIEWVKAKKPEMVFFMLMRDEVKPETIGKISKEYLTVNWFCDDQWRFESFTKRVAPNLTWSITMDKYSLDKFKSIGCNRVILSQWAVTDYVNGLDPENVDYDYDVSFVGGKNATRAWTVRELEKLGHHVACFGPGWKNGKVSYERMKEIFYKSRINLNLSNSIPRDPSFACFVVINFLRAILGFNRKCDGGYISSLRTAMRYAYNLMFPSKCIEQIKARNFEIPGFGGFQLGQFALEIEDYYVPGKEIALYSNIADLCRQIDFYLANDALRTKMAKAGYIRTVAYTYENRWIDIIKGIYS